MKKNFQFGLALIDGNTLLVDLVVDEMRSGITGNQEGYQVTGTYPGHGEIVEMYETYDGAMVRLYELALEESLRYAKIHQKVRYEK